MEGSLSVPSSRAFLELETFAGRQKLRRDKAQEGGDFAQGKEGGGDRQMEEFNICAGGGKREVRHLL